MNPATPSQHLQTQIAHLFATHHLECPNAPQTHPLQVHIIVEIHGFCPNVERLSCNITRQITGAVRYYSKYSRIQYKIGTGLSRCVLSKMDKAGSPLARKTSVYSYTRSIFTYQGTCFEMFH